MLAQEQRFLTAALGFLGMGTMSLFRACALSTVVVFGVFFGQLAWAGSGDFIASKSGAAALADLSLEELLNLEVTSASKKSQRLSDTAAAVYVITNEDIIQSGVRSIPEALRLAPGLQVTQVDASKWAISARGFNGRFANKLLVLRDGRTVYTPSFSGVFWDVQDTLLDDVERIEVIRGPGGTIWGTNAVNGVINIITKSSADTQRGLVTASYGDESAVSAAARYGMSNDNGLSYRVYGKYFDEDGEEDLTGQDTADDWQMLRGGLRLDWANTDRSSLSLLSEVYSADVGERLNLATLSPPYLRQEDFEQDLSGFFTLGRWDGNWGQGHTTQLQVFYDRTDRDTRQYGEERGTFDVEFQSRLEFWQRHDVIVGIGYRSTRLELVSSDLIDLTLNNAGDDPFSNRDVKRYSVVNLFVNDEISLIEDRLALVLGVKFEKNDMSRKNVDVMPSARMRWNATDSTVVWGAVTRAVRIPSHVDLSAEYIRDINPVIPAGVPPNPTPIPLRSSVRGNEDLMSEKLVAYEIGYRTLLGQSVNLDIATYYNEYDDLRGGDPIGILCEPSGEDVSVNPACIFGSTYVSAPIGFNNDLEGNTKGLEAVLNWHPSQNLKFSGSYSLLKMDLSDSGSGAVSGSGIEASSPEHQLYFRAGFVLPANLNLNLGLRFVDDIDYYSIDSYWEADANLIWKPTESLHLALRGANLLDDAHREANSELNDIVPTAIERSVYATLRWSF